MTPETLNMDGRYSVAGWGAGIAWYLVGYATEWTEERWEHDGEGDPEDEASYWYCEPEEIENRQMVRAIMVGDDRTFEIDIDDLTEISEDDYCPGCVPNLHCSLLRTIGLDTRSMPRRAPKRTSQRSRIDLYESLGSAAPTIRIVRRRGTVGNSVGGMIGAD